LKKAGRDWRVNKRALQIFDLEKFNLRNLKKVEGKEEYQIAVENKFAALQNLFDLVDLILGNCYREYPNFSHGQYRLL
jgi:hypothetical protein